LIHIKVAPDEAARLPRSNDRSPQAVRGLDQIVDTYEEPSETPARPRR